jgi:LmbE family N-acetylglucosaminyl deacetylase
MKKALLTILAHPDDESFGPGGTLAKYSAEGVDVHIAIATDGAAGSVVDEFIDKRAELANIRARELDLAVTILGGTLHRLGYRDSGMTGDPANDHPDAFIRSDTDEAIKRVVKLIRTIRPQVVMTHDETGGYFHPDHIRCWEITTAAFHAAADDTRYPELGLPPFQAQRLYYSAFSNRWVKVFVALMRLRGQDPTQMGRNKDIDFTRLGWRPERIHTRIDCRPYAEIKRQASAAHVSQGGGGLSRSRMIPELVQRIVFSRETFMRAHPPTPNGYRERDFFR